MGTPADTGAERQVAARQRVFISYSRDDLDFTEQLYESLGLFGFDCKIDRRGISSGEDWRARLSGLIAEADTVVFVLSPASTRSDVCAWEVGEAIRFAKRILPVVCRPFDGHEPPEPLRRLNYTYFYAEPKAPGAGFGTGLSRLVTALGSDFEWLRDNTRYLQHAREWAEGGRNADRLLTGGDIAQAKAWMARRPHDAPELSELQLEYFHASEEEAERRSNTRRQELEQLEVAAAEREFALTQAEAALAEAEEARRRRAGLRRTFVGALAVFCVVALGLSWQSWRLWREAEHNLAVAEQQRAEAERQRATFRDLHDRASDVIVKIPRIPKALEREVRRVFEAGAAAGIGRSMSNLGALLLEGRGIEKDEGRARQLFEQAAALEFPQAIVNLALLYESGLAGLPKDPVKARELFDRAAAMEWPHGMVGMGRMCEADAVPDLQTARAWYAQAAGQNNPEAMRRLGLCYLRANGVERDAGLARKWLEEAAAREDGPSMRHLADLYVKGDGVPKDRARAFEYLEHAAFVMASSEDHRRDILQSWRLQIAKIDGAYADALAGQEELLGRVEAQEMRNLGKPGPATAKSLINLSWLLLLVREPAKALAAAERGLAFAEEVDALEINLAHALMFVGRDEDALSRYRHVLRPREDKAAGQRWADAVRQDLIELEAAGLSSPLMATVRAGLPPADPPL